MTIIGITPKTNGAHDNQTINVEIPVPDGWAVVPEELGTPETLEHFPFGDITVEDADGVPTVTSWTPLPIPEPEEPEPGPEPETPVTWDALAGAIKEGVNEV